MYFTKESKKQFLRLDPVEAKKVLKKLEQLDQNPDLGKILIGNLRGKFSLRAWPYRIIYQKHQGTILIISIQHRKDVYRDIS